MVKKLRQKANESTADHRIVEALKTSAQQIWLAGVGAFAKTQKESQKLVDALDQLETAFEQRIERTLERIGAPSHKAVAELTEKVQALTIAVTALSDKRALLQKATAKTTKTTRTGAAKSSKKVAKKAKTKGMQKTKKLNTRLTHA